MNLAEYKTIVGKERKKYEYLEYGLQKSIAQYLELQYPNVLFISNPINLNLTKAQRGMIAAINKKGFKCPDMIIFEARGGYHGMFLELKKESPYRLDGALKADKHLQAQYECIRQLRHEKNYHADFYWTFDQAQKAIDWYLQV